jgi:ribosome maturation factor RimP
MWTAGQQVDDEERWVQGPVGAASGTVEGRVAQVAVAQASPLGLAVLDVDVAPGRTPVVTVTVDVAVPDHGRLEPGGASPDPVDIDVIAGLARTLDATLVADGIVPAEATLEVSSPGVDRPLQVAEDFVRNLGREVEVVVEAGTPGVRGRIVAVEDGDVLLVARGDEHRIAIEGVTRAQLVLPW